MLMPKVVGVVSAVALLLLLLLASAAFVVPRSSAALPRWLTQSLYAPATPSTHDALLQRRRMRAPRDPATAPVVTTTGRTTKRAATNSHTQLHDRIWQRTVELMNAVAARIRAGTSGSSVQSRALPPPPRPYAYDLWLIDDTTDNDDARADSDACTAIYRDRTQRQVCAISI